MISKPFLRKREAKTYGEGCLLAPSLWSTLTRTLMGWLVVCAVCFIHPNARVPQ